MALADELRVWFERDIRFASWDENVLVREFGAERAEVRFYTDTNEYLFTITVVESDQDPVFDAEVTPRKTRAGQETSRSRSLLPPGKYRLDGRTWRRVMGMILGLEIVRIQRREIAQKDTLVSGTPANEEVAEKPRRAKRAQA